MNTHKKNWQSGVTFDKVYEIKAPIGTGGMGDIHLVRHLEWAIELAVKTPSAVIVKDLGGRKRFEEREAYEWIKIGYHPNITTCFYVRTLSDGIPRIFMEYVNGGNLESWLRQNRDASLSKMLDVAIQICWGVGWAHKNGLVHRDIKPANILLTKDDVPKITDLGLIKPVYQVEKNINDLVDGKNSEKQTLSMGTPGYASPEQWDNTAISFESDIFSLGIVIYEMLMSVFGWDDFQNSSPLQHPKLYRDHLSKTDNVLAKILEKCMAYEIETRYPNALSLAGELIDAYRITIGVDYLRESPNEVQILAGGLNNQGVSLMDLGKSNEAVQKWNDAVKMDPFKLESRYNLGVYKWRIGEISDEKLLEDLDGLWSHYGYDWKSSFLLSLIQMERGNYEEAGILLKELLLWNPGNQEIKNLYENLQSRLSSPPYKHVSTLENNDASICAVHFMSDGNQVMTGSNNGVVKVWGIFSGKRLELLAKNLGRVLCISRDGRFALSEGSGNSIKLWHINSGECLNVFRGHAGSVNTVAISADGHWILSGSEDSTLRLWDATTGKCIKILRGHTKRVYSVSMTPSGNLAISAGRDGQLIKWDLTSGSILHILKSEEYEEKDVGSFSQDPMKLVVGQVYALDEMTLGEPVAKSVSISDDGHLAVSGGYDECLYVWDMNSGQCLGVFKGHQNKINSVAMSPNKKYAASGGDDFAIRLWNIQTGKCLCTFHENSPIVSVVFSSDGKYLLSACVDNPARIWRTDLERFTQSPLQIVKSETYSELSETEAQLRNYLLQAKKELSAFRFQNSLGLLKQARSLPGNQNNPRCLEAWRNLAQYCQRVGLKNVWLHGKLVGHYSGVTSVQTIPGRDAALSTSFDGDLRLWNLNTLQCEKVLVGHSRYVWSIYISRDGSLALSGATDESMMLWDINTGKRMRSFEDVATRAESVCLSPDNKFAFKVPGPSIWEVRSGKFLHLLDDTSGSEGTIDISSDGRFLLSGTQPDPAVQSRSYERYKLILWEISTGRKVKEYFGHKNSIMSVRFSADNQFALTASMDNSIRLWNLGTGQCVQVLNGHSDWVLSAVLCPDNNFAVSGSKDNTVRIWDLTTGECLKILKGHTSAIHSVAISQDSRWLISGSADNTINVWELDWDIESHALKDWDNRIKPFLLCFIDLHKPIVQELPNHRTPTKTEIRLALTHSGHSEWGDSDFEKLIHDLQSAGFGYIKPTVIKEELLELSKELTDPPFKLNFLEKARQSVSALFHQPLVTRWNKSLNESMKKHLVLRLIVGFFFFIIPALIFFLIIGVVLVVVGLITGIWESIKFIYQKIRDFWR